MEFAQSRGNTDGQAQKASHVHRRAQEPVERHAARADAPASAEDALAVLPQNLRTTIRIAVQRIQHLSDSAFKSLRGQAWQDRVVDPILAEDRLILFSPPTSMTRAS